MWTSTSTLETELWDVEADLVLGTYMKINEY